jgi:hypothetical protein
MCGNVHFRLFLLLTIFFSLANRAQQERDWVLAEFKSGRSPIMLATDVASRGLGK